MVGRRVNADPVRNKFVPKSCLSVVRALYSASNLLLCLLCGAINFTGNSTVAFLRAGPRGASGSNRRPLYYRGSRRSPLCNRTSPIELHGFCCFALRFFDSSGSKMPSLNSLGSHLTIHGDLEDIQIRLSLSPLVDSLWSSSEGLGAFLFGLPLPSRCVPRRVHTP